MMSRDVRKAGTTLPRCKIAGVKFFHNGIFSVHYLLAALKLSARWIQKGEVEIQTSRKDWWCCCVAISVHGGRFKRCIRQSHGPGVCPGSVWRLARITHFSLNPRPIPGWALPIQRGGQ